nr:MAG TPA: hypothetical protein [Caudoviricetes sp.]
MLFSWSATIIPHRERFVNPLNQSFLKKCDSKGLTTNYRHDII